MLSNDCSRKEKVIMMGGQGLFVHQYIKIYHAIFLVFLMVLSVPVYAGQVQKPQGIYSSFAGGTVGSYINTPYLSGALIRVRWSELERREGQYDFSKIEKQRAPIKVAGKNWSLGVIAGNDVPEWLLGKTSSRMDINFRGQQRSIIPFWDDAYQAYAAKLAQALAQQYGSDPNLVLIYVPQQTANGIEGHFNGTPYDDLARQGVNVENWLRASEQAIDTYARAFAGKAIAFELHEILGSTEIPQAIMSYIAQHHKDQVGIGVWWLSGKEKYQRNLLSLLKQSDLSIYAQAIGNSSQRHRFPDNDYAGMFRQAEEMGVRYIEVWNYEFEKPVSPDVTNAIKSFAAGRR